VQDSKQKKPTQSKMQANQTSEPLTVISMEKVRFNRTQPIKLFKVNDPKKYKGTDNLEKQKPAGRAAALLSKT